MCSPNSDLKDLAEGIKFNIEESFQYNRAKLSESSLGLKTNGKAIFHHYPKEKSIRYQNAPHFTPSPVSGIRFENRYQAYSPLGPLTHKAIATEPNGISRDTLKQYQVKNGIKLLSKMLKTDNRNSAYNQKEIEYKNFKVGSNSSYTKVETWSQMTRLIGHEVQKVRETDYLQGLPVKEVTDSWYTKSYKYGLLGFLEEYQSGDRALVRIRPDYFLNIKNIAVRGYYSRSYEYDEMNRVKRVQIKNQVFDFNKLGRNCFEVVLKTNSSKRLKRSKECLDGFGNSASSEITTNGSSNTTVFQNFRNDVFGQTTKQSYPRDSYSSLLEIETLYNYRGKALEYSNGFYKKQYSQYFTPTGEGHDMVFDGTPIGNDVKEFWSESSHFAHGKRVYYSEPKISIYASLDHASEYQAIDFESTDQLGDSHFAPLGLNIRSDGAQSFGDIGSTSAYQTNYKILRGKETRTMGKEELSSVLKNKDSSVTQINLNDGTEIGIAYDGLGREKRRESQYFDINTAYNKRDAITYKTYEFNGNKIRIDFERDALDRAKVITLQNGSSSESISLNYSGELLSSTDFFTIERDSYFYPSKIDYAKAIVNLSYNQNGILKSWSTSSGASEEIRLNKCGKVSHISTNQKFDGLKSGTPRFGRFDYYNCGALKASLKATPQVDPLKRIDNQGLKYSGPSLRLSSIGSEAVKYFDQEVIFSVGDYYILESNLHYYKDHLIYYFEDSGKTIGAYILGPKYNDFYPIASDYLNSVRQIFDSRGKVISDRVYGVWGQVSESIKDQNKAEIAELIQKSYSALTSLPGNSDLLLSRTRVYLPSERRWNTVDPQKVWNSSDFFADHPGDFEGYSYTIGDPVNFVDPSGHSSIPVAIGAGVLMGGAVYMFFDRTATVTNHIDNQITTLDNLQSPREQMKNTKLASQIHTTRKQLFNLRTNYLHGRTKETIKNFSNPMDRANPSIFKQAFNFIKEIFNGGSSNETIEQSNEIIDNFQDKSGVEINVNE
jgi:RHS repeat-associated protein